MKQVLDLLAENSALKAELQRKEEVIQELRANGRKSVAQRLEKAEKKDWSINSIDQLNFFLIKNLKFLFLLLLYY